MTDSPPQSPVEAIPAATVLLLREATPPGGPARTRAASGRAEVYMVRRHVKSDFAADVYVFPGGKVDREDGDPELTPRVTLAASRSDDEAVRATWPALHVAAIRELFEETGVLLARRDGWALHLDDPGVAARFSEYRERVRTGTMTMGELAQREDLTFAADRLLWFSRWVTPETLPKRFDTFFFVTHMPEGQAPVHEGSRELTDGVWITPKDALARYEAGTFPLVFPTVMHLRALRDLETVAAIERFTGRADLRPVMPRIIARDGQQVFLLPGDPGYETA